MVDCAITIASDSGPYRLLVISDSSDAISTSLRSFLLIFYLLLPFQKNNIVPRSPRLCKTSDHLDLTRTAFLDIIPRTSTSTHCVLPHSTALFRYYSILACVSSV